MDDLVALARKLLTSLHLSVAERAVLPGGRMPFSAMLLAVDAELRATGWFPAERAGPELPGEGAVVELRRGALLLHERREVGVMRLSETATRSVPTLEDAVRGYIDATAGSDAIDGVPVAWRGAHG